MRILLLLILVCISQIGLSQDWGTYNALRGTTDWDAKRRAKEAQLKMIMQQESKRLDFYYGISCSEMANDVKRYGVSKVVLDKSKLNSNWLYKVVLYKTIYTTYEVIAYMYNNDRTDVKGYIYCHVKAVNWNAFVDKEGTSKLSDDQKFYKYIHNVEKYQCLCD